MGKKKSKKKQKASSLVLIVISIVVIIVLFVFLLFALRKPVYQVESRGRNIEKSQKKDSNGIKTVGWLRVQGTNIDYPIVKTSDNKFYLDHSYDKSYNKAGWVFMDYRNNNIHYDTNTIVYAHGRLDNTMFGSLRNVIKENWYTNSDNHIIKYSDLNSSSLWQVFSVYKIKQTNDYLDINFSTKDDYISFIDLIKGRSVYDFNCDVNVGDKILTLSSCYDDINRVVLHAKLIKYVEK